MWLPIALTAASAGVAALSNRGKRKQLPGTKTRQEIIDQLRTENNQSPTGTDFFQSGAGILTQQSRDQQDIDQATQGRLGAGGTEVALAQSATRGKQMGQGLLQLYGGADRSQRAGRSQLISALGQQDSLQQRQNEFDERRRSQRGAALGGALGNLASIYAQRNKSQ